MTGLVRYRRMYTSSRFSLLALSFLAAVALSLPAAANATDAGLRATLAQWSHRIAVDAQGIGLSAARRHPRRMIRRARHFRLDALRARKGLAAVQPSPTSRLHTYYTGRAGWVAGRSRSQPVRSARNACSSG